MIRKIPNKIKKLSLENRIEASNKMMYTAPEIPRFRVSFMFTNLLVEANKDF